MCAFINDFFFGRNHQSMKRRASAADLDDVVKRMRGVAVAGGDGGAVAAAPSDAEDRKRAADGREPEPACNKRLKRHHLAEFLREITTVFTFAFRQKVGDIILSREDVTVPGSRGAQLVVASLQWRNPCQALFTFSVGARDVEKIVFTDIGRLRALLLDLGARYAAPSTGEAGE
jgi:hypothetical protein